MLLRNTHRSMPYSAIIRDASALSRLEQIQRLTVRNYVDRETETEGQRLEYSALNEMSPSNFSLIARGTLWKEETEKV